MRRLTRLIDNEQGVALVLALMILLTLTGLVLAFLSASAFEPQISRNHGETVRARYVAEAGVEYAYDTLASNVGSWNSYLAGATCALGAGLGAPDSTLPGLGSAHGTFTVRIRNDCKPGDDKLTGVAVDTAAGSCGVAAPGDATHDSNCKLIVTSTGTIGTTTRAITVVVSKTVLPVNGALAFPGSQADVSVRASTFVIDGRDTRLADRPGVPTGGEAAVYGVAFNGGLPGLAARLEAVLAAGAQHDLRGKDKADPSATARGANTIRADGALTSQAVIDFVDAAKSAADVTISASPGNGFTLGNIGATCATDVESSTCWGTTARPKIVYVRGALPDVDTRSTSLGLAGTSSGTGILIVENGIVEIGGDFRWNGPIVASGRNVGIRFRGDGNQVVYGAAIVNELNPAAAGNVEGDASGKPYILYSSEALGLVQNALNRRLVTTQSWTDQ
ncbi:MAG: pilus assembly PilX family protein [Candidatus Rokuibacteriota bacterium]